MLSKDVQYHKIMIQYEYFAKYQNNNHGKYFF